VRKNRVLVLIDQATRDGFGQLLIVHYLRSKGVKVYVANQGTFISACERYRPDVVFASWQSTGVLMEHLERIHSRTQVVLIDQESAKMGREPFKRSFEASGRAKAKWGHLAKKICVWGALQAQWLLELGVVKEEQIVVTGSAKLDPYLLPLETPPGSGRHIGFTFRYDPLTASPMAIMEGLFEFAIAGLHGVGYPSRAQYEDRIWHVVAAARQMFKLIDAVSKKFDVRMVVRPGPWEHYGVYKFLSRRIPHVAIEPWELQHDYIRNAFVVVDESSSFGIEALVAGIPVISIQRLIPRIEEHIAGEGGGLYHAPYMRYYWKPATVEEAVEWIEKASCGGLAPVPCADGLDTYLKDLHHWPRARPAAFEIGDAILALLDAPTDVSREFEPPSQTSDLNWKRWVYRHIPGSADLAKARMFLSVLLSSGREHLVRYHYFRWLYPYHRAVAETVAALLRRYGDAASQCPHQHYPR